MTCGEEYTVLILWNPFTGEYKKLPKTEAPKNCYKMNGLPFGLYHTSFDDDYKLLCVHSDFGFSIYSLKNNAWRNVVISTNETLWGPSFLWESVSTWLNGSLYFLLQRGESKKFARRTYSIIRFDTKREKFTSVATPSFGNQTSFFLSFTTLRVCLHLCVMLNDIERDPDPTRSCIELWRMNTDTQNWTKVLTYPWIPCMEIGPKMISVSHLQPLHLMRNDSLRMRYLYNDGLYMLDPEKHTNNKLTTNISKCMEIPRTSWKYIETFVSPNEYMRP
ncbi:putative F-box domain-containing protein [Tanacetum coccineum]